MRVSRRHLIAAAAGGLACHVSWPTLAFAGQQMQFPMGLPDRLPGDGFFIRHGYQCENTWFVPGWWHTGENWYLIDGDTAGADVYAIGQGEVVYADFDYPGRVVIVEHASDLFSMYGHLDYQLDVRVGETVARGQRLGTILNRTDGRAPSHLHFEVRTFFQRDDVNGASPTYTFNCGFQCLPGPGYWPMWNGELPRDYGWLNPTLFIVESLLPGKSGEVDIVVNAAYAGQQVEVFDSPDGVADPVPSGKLTLSEGTRIAARQISVASADTPETSASAYRIWYRIDIDDGQSGWVRGTRTSDFETGADGRPSTVELVFLPLLNS